jgi:hypothetical protein
MKSDRRAADLNRVVGEEVRDRYQNVYSGRDSVRTTYKPEDKDETESCDKQTMHRAFTMFLIVFQEPNTKPVELGVPK